MIAKGVKKYLLNPSLGLLASILYITLFYVTGNVGYSLVIGIIFAGVSDLSLRYYAKAGMSGLLFIVNFAALSITLISWLLLRKVGTTNLFYIVFYEIVFFCLIAASRIFKTYLSIYFGKRKQSVVQKTFLGEYFEVAKFLQYAITFHLFIIILYRYVYENIYVWETLDTFFYYIVPNIFSCAIIIYEEIKIRNIVRRLRREEWLPIVNETGEVTGRIARSVSRKMKNKFMHPVVRIALVHEGKIYLQKRPDIDSLDSETYDHPFEKYMLFNHEINMTARNSISRLLGVKELPFNFLLKYVFENEESKRLIFLFVSRVQNDEQLETVRELNGKFWTMKQIEDSFNDKGVFSECFRLEYEYLKNTVLQTELLKKSLSL